MPLVSILSVESALCTVLVTEIDTVMLLEGKCNASNTEYFCHHCLVISNYGSD